MLESSADDQQMIGGRLSAEWSRAVNRLLRSAEPGCQAIAGIAIGPRDPSRGFMEPVLFVYLNQPVARETLPLRGLAYPPDLVVTRVTGDFIAASAPSTPAGPGSAIVTHGVPGHGTLGGFLRDSQNRTFGLSCAHVLKTRGAQVLAHSPTGPLPLGEVAALVSPGPRSVPADAGLIRLLPGVVQSPFPSTLTPVDPTPLDPVHVRRAAHHGAASGYREANVLAYRASIRVFTGESRVYQNVVVFDQHFAAAGDSGSLVFSFDESGRRRPLAMIFAKSNDDPDTESLTLGCSFSAVIASLSTLVGSPLSLVV